MKQYIREMKLTSGVNHMRAEEAWNTVSGMARYTLSVSLEKKIMTCTLNSSLVRNQLYFQKDVLLEKINAFLKEDNMFDCGNDDSDPVKVLVLK